MYAIRSYYVRQIKKYIADAKKRDLRVVAKIEKPEAVNNVITSYSIHYTKLYEIMIGTLNLAGTSHLWASGTAVEAEDVQTAVESQLAEPQDFAGTVAETEKGIVLKTADGIFFLV